MDGAGCSEWDVRGDLTKNDTHNVSHASFKGGGVQTRRPMRFLASAPQILNKYESVPRNVYDAYFGGVAIPYRYLACDSLGLSIV